MNRLTSKKDAPVHRSVTPPTEHELHSSEGTSLFNQLMDLLNKSELKHQTPKQLEAQLVASVDHMKLILDGLSEDLKRGALDIEGTATLVEGVKSDLGPCQQGVDVTNQALNRLRDVDTTIKSNLKSRTVQLKATMSHLKRLSRAYVQSRESRCFEGANDTTAEAVLMRLLDAIAPENDHNTKDHVYTLRKRVRKSAFEKLDAKLPVETRKSNWQQKIGPSLFNLLPSRPFTQAQRDFERLNEHYEAIVDCVEKCD
jgi:hypothetical protein